MSSAMVGNAVFRMVESSICMKNEAAVIIGSPVSISFALRAMASVLLRSWRDVFTQGGGSAAASAPGGGPQQGEDGQRIRRIISSEEGIFAPRA